MTQRSWNMFDPNESCQRVLEKGRQCFPYDGVVWELDVTPAQLDIRDGSCSRDG